MFLLQALIPMISTAQKQEVIKRTAIPPPVMINTAEKQVRIVQMAIQQQVTIYTEVKPEATKRAETLQPNMNSNGVTTAYDKYGRKTGSFKTDSSGKTVEYDKYGRKVGSYK